MSSPLTDESALWGARSPLGELLALERRWVASRRIATGNGARVWIGPASDVGGVDDGIALAIGERAELSGAMRARLDALPFGDGTVRLLVLQHALDRRLDPAVFGECVRVLATGGELLVFGLNPISPWRPWLAWQARRNRARPRARMAGRVGALFGQLGLGTEALAWIGPSRPGAAGEGDASRSTGAMFRAAYALSMKKPHDTVIPLRPRLAERDVGLAAGLVPNATPRIRVGA